MMRVLIVGGAGYIGSHVVLELMAKGHECVVFDDFSTGNEINLQPQNKLIRGSILCKKELHAAFAQVRPECVVHLAALKNAGESMLVPEKYSTHNIEGSLNLLNLCTEFEVKYFVFSSSAATFGSPVYIPMDENHPTQPENYYGYTKLAIEQYLAWYSKLRGMRFAALRYFNAAGYDAKGRILGLERKPANLIPVVMETLCGIRPQMQVFGNDYDTPDGTGIRDYVHVSDLARAHVQALDVISQKNEDIITNLGSETGYSVMEIIEQAQALTGLKVNYQLVGRRAGDPAKVVAASAHAGKVLGWQAKESNLIDLIATTWQVYRHHYPVHH
jgi:UDP-glucose 4-epimerase